MWNWMVEKSAVIFIPDDTAKTGCAQPLMLQRVMGTPLLRWLVDALFDQGVSRYYLVCHDKFLQEAKHCFPVQVTLQRAKDQDAADLLHVFLSTADEAEQSLLVITGPCVYLPSAAPSADENAPKHACVCRVSRTALMDALDEHFSFARVLLESGTACTDCDGMYTVSGVQDLAYWQPLMKRDLLHRLAHQGVGIWDFENCYVEPGVCVGIGTQLMPGSILQGKTVVGRDCVIGPNARLVNATVGSAVQINASQVSDSVIGSDVTIGPFANIHSDCIIGGRTRVGSFVELRKVKSEEGCSIARLSYLSDMDIGRGSRIHSALAVPAEEGERRTVMGNDVCVGGGAQLIGALHLGAGAHVAAGSTVTEDVPERTLAVARTRQVNKRLGTVKK